MFVFLQVIHGDTSSIAQLEFITGSFFLMIQTLVDIYFVEFNLLYLFPKFLLLFLAGIVLACVCLKISCVHQFALARFCLFSRYRLFFAFPLFINIHCVPQTTFFPPSPSNDRL